ncbi:MAG: FecR family protein [Acidovorax sp.]|uniref:FecR family protein n=1 Tax=Acidovorax sp. TaxID=1872122 RepID=UPI00391B251A
MTAADHIALQWFVRGVGTLDPEDRRAFDDWWAADPSHAAAWARWAEDWSQLDALPAEGLQHLRHRLAQDKARAAAHRPWGSPLRFLTGRLHRAWGRPTFALASLCLVVASGWLGWSHWQQQPVFVQTVATGFGQQSEVQLPDGSTLRLDTHTRLDVTFRRQRREVILPEGQALFRVQGDTARPFDVVAGPLRITVVGTRFSVRHTPGVPGEEGVRIAVEEGRVRVARSNAADPTAVVELTAGQQVSSNAAGVLGPVAAVAPAGIAPWRDGRVSFDDTPLSQALAEFERYGASRLVVRDASVAALRLTGTFDPRRLDNFMRALPKVLPVQLRTQGDTTEIIAAPLP